MKRSDRGAGDAAAVVLIHGAWHGAWCWQRVADALAAAGVSAVAVDLPGHGDSSEPLGDLHADADLVTSVLDSLDRPAVLVGHSYGGAVITDAGRHPAVAHLVYISALALDEGESCVNAASAEAAATGLSHEGRPDLGAGFVPGDDGTVTIDPHVARECFYHDCDPATADWAVGKLGPQRLTSLQQEPREVAWRHRSSTYVVCANDQASHPGLQRLLARRCTSSLEWPTGHSPFLSRPGQVVGLLLGLAFGRRLPSTIDHRRDPPSFPGFEEPRRRGPHIRESTGVNPIRPARGAGPVQPP